MPTAKEIQEMISEKYGSGIVTNGEDLEDLPRLPTGNFAFDLATGGGFPQCRISILYGPESSLKSSLMLQAMARAQELFPEKSVVLMDLEVSYDPKWGAKMGIDNSRLIRVLPEYGERAVDILDAYLYGEDVSLIGVDSLAAILPLNEANSSADKASVGGAGLLISKLYRKAVAALGQAERQGRNITVILINQVRSKIGVMYGSPETMPGGWAPKFVSALTVRLYGSDELDKEVHPAIPAWKVCKGVIKKYKVPITSQNFEFKMATLPNPNKYLAIGQVYDWPLIEGHLKDLGLLAKAGSTSKHWTLFGEKYSTLKELRLSVLEDWDLQQQIKQAIIDAVMSVFE